MKIKINLKPELPTPWTRSLESTRDCQLSHILAPFATFLRRYVLSAFCVWEKRSLGFDIGTLALADSPPLLPFLNHTVNKFHNPLFLYSSIAVALDVAIQLDEWRLEMKRFEWKLWICERAIEKLKKIDGLSIATRRRWFVLKFSGFAAFLIFQSKVISSRLSRLHP